MGNELPYPPPPSPKSGGGAWGDNAVTKSYQKAFGDFNRFSEIIRRYTFEEHSEEVRSVPLWSGNRFSDVPSAPPCHFECECHP